jgi:hypothetical protein
LRPVGTSSRRRRFGSGERSRIAGTAEIFVSTTPEIVAISSEVTIVLFGQGGEMIPGSFTLAAWVAQSLVAASLVVPVSIDRSTSGPLPEPGTALPLDKKVVAVDTLVSSATECIARTVAANPRLAVATADELNELIVESVPLCTDHLRAMIDGYNRIYGEGAGETFFNGAYLDGLPGAVTTRVKGRAKTGVAAPE